VPYIQAADGNEIYFNDWGHGAPVVLIHGWPLSSASWEYQARVLAESGYRVIAYDRRGFGRSGHSYSGYDYNTLAGDLATLIDTLDLTGAALVGFSMGGGEVARYLGGLDAIRNRVHQRIRKAVLISAVTPYLLKTEDNPEGVDGSVFEQMRQGVIKDRPAFLKDFFPKFFGRSVFNHTVSDAQLEFALIQALQASPKATLDCITAFSASDFRDDCLRIGVPTLVIHGTADQTVPIDVSARRAAAMIPGAEQIEYDGQPHGLIVTAADRVNRDLLDFLAR
jgi:pimeloyl-ACP methyl ester carboxylesterase